MAPAQPPASPGSRHRLTAFSPLLASPVLIVLALLLSINPGLAQPAPPETVVAVPYDPLEHQGDQGGFILLTWDAVDGADGYRIWREILVSRGLDDEGNIVEFDTPRNVLVPWGRIDAVPGEPVVSAIVATLDAGSTTLWAVTTLQGTDGGWLESEPRYFHVQVEGVGTGVRARSWGDVKQLPRKDAG